MARAKTEGVSLNTLVVSLVSQGIGKQQVAERVDRRVTRRAPRTKAKTAHRLAWHVKVLQHDSSPQHHPRRPRGKPNPCVASYLATTQRYRREDVLRCNYGGKRKALKAAGRLSRRTTSSILTLCSCFWISLPFSSEQHIGHSRRRQISTIGRSKDRLHSYLLAGILGQRARRQSSAQVRSFSLWRAPCQASRHRRAGA